MQFPKPKNLIERKAKRNSMNFTHSSLVATARACATEIAQLVALCAKWDHDERIDCSDCNFEKHERNEIDEFCRNASAHLVRAVHERIAAVERRATRIDDALCEIELKRSSELQAETNTETNTERDAETDAETKSGIVSGISDIVAQLERAHTSIFSLSKTGHSVACLDELAFQNSEFSNALFDLLWPHMNTFNFNTHDKEHYDKDDNNTDKQEDARGCIRRLQLSACTSCNVHVTKRILESAAQTDEASVYVSAAARGYAEILELYATSLGAALPDSDSALCSCANEAIECAIKAGVSVSDDAVLRCCSLLISVAREKDHPHFWTRSVVSYAQLAAHCGRPIVAKALVKNAMSKLGLLNWIDVVWGIELPPVELSRVCLHDPLEFPMTQYMLEELFFQWSAAKKAVLEQLLPDIFEHPHWAPRFDSDEAFKSNRLHGNIRYIFAYKNKNTKKLLFSNVPLMEALRQRVAHIRETLHTTEVELQRTKEENVSKDDNDDEHKNLLSQVRRCFREMSSLGDVVCKRRFSRLQTAFIKSLEQLAKAEDDANDVIHGTSFFSVRWDQEQPPYTHLEKRKRMREIPARATRIAKQHEEIYTATRYALSLARVFLDKVECASMRAFSNYITRKACSQTRV